MTDVRIESIKKALGLTDETRKREPGGVGAQHSANFPGTEPCGERPPSADHRANRRSAAGALLRALTMFAPDSPLEGDGFELGSWWRASRETGLLSRKREWI